MSDMAWDDALTAAGTHLQEFARQLHGWGAAVTAIKAGTKRPGHKWQHWQTQPQTRPELDGLPWIGAAAVGIVNGSGGFRVLDIDAAKDGTGLPIAPVPESVVVDLLIALGLPDDYQWSYRSGSGAGFGVVVRCNEPLPPDWAAGKGVYVGRPADGRSFGQLELRWSSGQTVIDGAHPTGPGYRWRWGDRPFVPPALLTAARVVAGFLAIAEHPVVEERRSIADGKTMSGWEATTGGRYAEATLADAIRQVSTATTGNRNNTLFRQTAALAELVNGGVLTQANVERGMTGAALAAGLEANETAATIASAFKVVGSTARAPNPSVNRDYDRAAVQSQNGDGATNGAATIIKSEFYIQTLTDLGYTFKLNELDDAVEVNGKPISDALRAKIFSLMADRGFKGMERVEYIYTGHAYDNRYHPIKDYLGNLDWDGQNHIDQFLHHLLFAEREKTARKFFIRWMLGAVGKVFNQDQNFMLVLDGPQDIGKSFLARWLCPLPDYFIEGAIVPDDKDSILRLCRHWIWEVGELQSTTRRADREALKNFITIKQVKVRKPYGRYDLNKPACASMIGTINESGSGFLDDRTGNRRFAVVNLKRIDWSYAQAIDVNQLWAEVMAAYLAGERGTLSPEEKREQSVINANYGSLSTVEEYLWAYYEIAPDNKDWRPVHDILATLERNGLTGNQRANMMELGQILKSKESEGVKKGRPKLDGVKTTSYKGLRNAI